MHMKTRTGIGFSGLLPAVLAFMLAMVFAQPVLAADMVVRIGNIIPLSGPSATVGQQGKYAREMAVEEINAAGGIKSLGGARLTLVFADSESKPEKGGDAHADS
jgi:branched-chain amino acid transport system substrate-binding protein